MAAVDFDILHWIHDFSVLIIVCLIVTTPAAKYCYHGFDVSSSYSLENQSCATGQVHISKTLLEANQETSPVYKEGGVHYADDEELSSYSARDNKFHCFIFRSVATQTIFPDIQHESVHIEFGCDLNNLCFDKELDKVLHQEMVNGSKSQLYCCNIENCNKVSVFPHLPAENRICYHGTNNKSAEKESCAHPDVMCARTTTYLPDGKVENYFCDNDKQCHDKMSAGSFRSCHSLLIDNTTQELCCCDTSLCFVPPDAEIKNINLNVSHVSDTRFIDKMADETDDKMAITGLVFALVFVTGIVGGIILMMVCKKRRRPRPDPNLIMQYERLSASDCDVDDAVVL